MKNSFIALALVVFSSAFFSTSELRADTAPGWLIQPSLIYYFTTEGGNPPNQQNTTVTRELGDFLLGYSFGTIFLGANYNYDAIVTAGNSTTTDSFSSIGADLVLLTDNIFLFFTYYFSSTGAINQGAANETDFNKGTGYQLKLGYMFDVGSGWSLGPALTYKSLTYAAFANGPNSGQSTSYTYTTLVPEATIRYRF
jgi:hypothetical protein